LELVHLTGVLDGTTVSLEESPDRKTGTATSNICGYNSITPFNKANVVFVSELVQEKLVKARANKCWHMYHRLLPEHSTIKGGIFEDIALTNIARGLKLNGTHWEYKGKGADYNVTKIEKEFTKKELCEKTSLRGHLKEDGALNKSSDKTEELIDGSSAEGTFQMTINENHRNSRRGAKKVTDDWNATAENKMPLYYVVPDSRYLDWSNKKKPPSFKGPEPPGWEGDEAMYAKIDFFVLAIAMGPDVMEQFSGLKMN